MGVFTIGGTKMELRQNNSESDIFVEVEGERAMGFFPTKPTMIITTLHENGIVNAGVFGAYTNLSPTQVGIAISKHSHTFNNILRTKEFVINIPGADLVKKIAILADSIQPTQSELELANLTAKPNPIIKTPSIKECQSAIYFKYERDIPIGLHHFVIGKVIGGWIRKDVMTADGKLDIFKARIFKDFDYPRPVYVLPGEVIHG